MSETFHPRISLAHGGEWLGTARTWMQSNVRFGDSLTWGSNESVQVSFAQLEELAFEVAIAAVLEERKRVAQLEERNRRINATV